MKCLRTRGRHVQVGLLPPDRRPPGGPDGPGHRAGAGGRRQPRHGRRTTTRPCSPWSRPGGCGRTCWSPGGSASTRPARAGRDGGAGLPGRGHRVGAQRAEQLAPTASPVQQRLQVVSQRSRPRKGNDLPMADFELKHPGGQLPLPVTGATEGPSGLEVSTLLKDTGYVTLDPGFVNTASCASAITFIDGDEGILRYRGYPIDQLAEKSSFLEVSYLLIYGELPTAGRARGLRPEHPQPHAAARGPAPVLRRLPARRAPDGGPLVGRQRAVDLLPGQPRPVRPRARRPVDGPADGQAADHRVVRLQEVGRAAAALPRQLPRLRRQLPADDLRRAGRAVRGRRDDVPRARHALRPARRPRAELLHVDRAAGRLQQRQPLRLGLGRRQRPVRPAARRRQPGRARDAAAASTTTATTSRASSAGSRTRSPASS